MVLGGAGLGTVEGFAGFTHALASRTRRWNMALPQRSRTLTAGALSSSPSSLAALEQSTVSVAAML